jgi:hypothetical protein
MLEKEIEGHLHQKLGYEVATFVRTPSEMAGVVAYKPFKASELVATSNSLYIGFLSEAPAAAATKRLLAFANDMDEFRIQGREIYWLRRKKFSESKCSGAHLEGRRNDDIAQYTVRRSCQFTLPCYCMAPRPLGQAPAVSGVHTAEGVVRDTAWSRSKGQVTDWEQCATSIPGGDRAARVEGSVAVFDVRMDRRPWRSTSARASGGGFSEKIVVAVPVFATSPTCFLYEAAITDSDRHPRAVSTASS